MVINPYSEAGTSHPLCPSCQTNEEVCRKTRVEIEEYHWLDEEGDVINSTDGDERYETGYAWYCSACGYEWDHEGTLAPAAPTPSYAVYPAIEVAELRAAEAFCLELRKFQGQFVDSARSYLSQHGGGYWSAVDLATLLRRGLSHLPESWDAHRWPIPDWSQV